MAKPPGDLDDYYRNFYHSMIGFKSEGLSGILARYPHKLMESNFKDNSDKEILEVGVGNFEHLPFVVNNFKKYVAVDLRDPFTDTHKQNPKICFIKSDAHTLPFRDDSFDRVIATCLVVHLKEPEIALDEWLRVLRPGGKLTFYIALEPSIFLELFRKLFMIKKARRLGFEGYELFIARDHITYGLRIIKLIKSKYSNRYKLRFRPFRAPLWAINAFCLAEIRK